MFPSSGVGIARTEEVEVIFISVLNGINGTGSHTHNDKLSVTARIRGVEFFCDSGTGCYMGDPKLRNQLRSTAAHNTIIIDGVEQYGFDPETISLIVTMRRSVRLESMIQVRKSAFPPRTSGTAELAFDICAWCGCVHRRFS
jgi:hypothetical protein